MYKNTSGTEIKWKTKRSNILSQEPRKNNNIIKTYLAFIENGKAKNLKESTLTYHKNALKSLQRLCDYHDIDDINELTEERIIEYIKFRLDCGIKPKTINSYLRSWRPYGNFLVERGYLRESPFKNIDDLRTEKLIVRTFTDRQLRIILDTPNKNTFTGYRDYVLMLLFLETGIRLSEALNLRLTDILWDEGRIKVYGKGRKERYVPFQTTLEKHLRNYIRIRGNDLDHDYVFISIENQPLKNRSVQTNFEKYGRMAKIRNVRCTPHTFRYTFVKKYVMNGADPFSLRAILGHTSMEMVMHYCQLFSRDISKQHEKFSPLEHFIKEKDNIEEDED